jgi:hypothetical protein
MSDPDKNKKYNRASSGSDYYAGKDDTNSQNAKAYYDKEKKKNY